MCFDTLSHAQSLMAQWFCLFYMVGRRIIDVAVSIKIERERGLAPALAARFLALSDLPLILEAPYRRPMYSGARLLGRRLILPSSLARSRAMIDGALLRGKKAFWRIICPVCPKTHMIEILYLCSSYWVAIALNESTCSRHSVVSSKNSIKNVPNLPAGDKILITASKKHLGSASCRLHF